jgi:hypothetical protein
VRGILVCFCLTICATVARAQVQEGKLVHRLLKPDMTLANSAQNREFVAAGGTPVDRKFEAKSFYAGDDHISKSYGGLKDFLAHPFWAKKFARAEASADGKANAEIAYAKSKFETNESSLIHTSNEASKQAAVHGYADNKPFLGKGTRQKILSQQDHPLTIDAIRELLNKNK